MFQKISILVILFLGMAQVRADVGHLIEDEDTQSMATALSNPLRAVISQEITEINRISGRKVEKLLRANGTIYILARYANALWDYHFLKALDRDAMAFVEIDLGTYFTEIASAETENDALCFTMNNGVRYQLNGNGLVPIPE